MSLVYFVLDFLLSFIMCDIGSHCNVDWCLVCARMGVLGSLCFMRKGNLCQHFEQAQLPACCELPCLVWCNECSSTSAMPHVHIIMRTCTHTFASIHTYTTYIQFTHLVWIDTSLTLKPWSTFYLHVVHMHPMLHFELVMMYSEGFSLVGSNSWDSPFKLLTQSRDRLFAFIL